MYTINAKATTTKIRVVASKPTKEIKWSNKKYSIQKQAEKQEKGKKNNWDKQKINSIH